MPSLDMLRNFAGVPPETDDTVLGLCLDTAIQWYAENDIPPQGDNAVYDYWILNLAAWLYDNRGAGGDTSNMPSFVVSGVHLLRKAAST